MVEVKPCFSTAFFLKQNDQHFRNVTVKTCEEPMLDPVRMFAGAFLNLNEPDSMTAGADFDIMCPFLGIVIPLVIQKNLYMIFQRSTLQVQKG